MKIKFFLFLITLQLSFISTFFTSNIAVASTQPANQLKLNSTVNLTDEQVKQIIEAIKQQPLDEQVKLIIEATKQQPLNVKVETLPQPKSGLEKYVDLLLPIIFGTLLGIFVTIVQTKINGRRNKILNSIELIEIWDSESMRKSRTNAWDNIERSLCLVDLKEIINTSPHKVDLLRIKDFFDRLTVIKEQKILDDDLSKKLFSSDYIDWHDKYFTRNTEWSDWVSESNNLDKWLYQSPSQNGDIQ
jgi:hypothetical protein